MRMSSISGGHRWLRARAPVRRLFRATLPTVVLVACFTANGADWPTYQHDIARSGVTAERLAPPLSLRWVFQARHAPEPAWETPKPTPIEDYLELPRIRFDDAFHVAVTGDSVYFGSSADNKVYCLDASTGRTRWDVFTGGPVRLAPTVSDGRVYVCSDDGFVYCLNAADGRAIWKFRAAPRNDRVLGNGRMISLWPPRSGVLVDGGVAYFSAGVFPAEGIYIYAVRAADGTLIWRNDTSGELHAGQAGLSPQGYLLASADTLFAPMGRVAPSAFDRKDGRLLYSGPYFGKGTGGSYALLTGEHILSGGEQLVVYDQKAPQHRFAWFTGRRLIVTRDTSYMADEKEMFAVDRKSYWAASLRYQATPQRLQAIQGQFGVARGNLVALLSETKPDRERMSSLQKQLETLTKAGQQTSQRFVTLKAQRDALAKTSKARADEQNALKKQMADLAGQLKAAAEEVKNAEAAMMAAVKWRMSCQTPDSMILAGGVLLAGGKGQIVAVDSSTGKELWRARVNGKARGLAAANGHLFVSTDTGAIYCFGNTGVASVGKVIQASNPTPYPRDELTPIFEAAAEAIVQDTGIKNGHCLVWGCGTGRLAFELAKRTQLMIYGVEQDAEKVKRSRKALDAAGLYGPRVCIECFPLSRIPYSDYFADLIVSETALVSGKAPGDASEMFRMLRPQGGVAYIGQPGQRAVRSKRLEPAALRSWVAKADIKDAQVSQTRGVWLKVTRGPLEGAANWTHQYADAGNTACSGDRLAKCPLGILWFGAPGPGKMASRHASAAAPLAVNGRLFVQGENVIMAYDAYNGRQLWEREIPGAIRSGLKTESGNLAGSDDSLFVAVGDKCLRLDAATGETMATYTLPPSQDDGPRKWGYVAVVDNLLFGSTTPERDISDSVFATDIESGKHIWIHRGWNIANISLALGDGCVFLAEKMSGYEKVMGLTSDWLFATDPEDRGTREGWFRESFERKDWIRTSAGRNWQEFKKGYYGSAWYAKEFLVPAEMKGKALKILFKGVDEDCWVYLNEKLVFSRVSKPMGQFWNRPFMVAVSDKLRYGDKNLLVVRVRKFAFQTGIYGPVQMVEMSERDAARIEAALKERTEQLKQLKGAELEKAQHALEAAEVRLIVALDMATGDTRWQKPIDVSDCIRVSIGGGELTAIYRNKVLLLCAAPWNGHFWREFFAGEFSRRSIIALSSEDGKLLWSRKIGYRSRPLVVGDTVIAEPWACDLRTGEPKKRVNPVTGKPERWQFARPGHHCGWVSASASALFFRSWTIAWYDLNRDYGTSHFGAIRPGCCINAIPANGLVLIPEASSGCMCPFPNMCTVVLKPRQTDRAWGMFSASSSIRPARHMAINVGAPGDRRDEQGTLWLSYPRPDGHGLVLKFELNTSVLPGGGYFQRDPESIPIQGTDAPWVFASGCTGLTQCKVPLIDKGQPPALYTVRLAFVELVHDRAGQRLFDIRLQDRVVLKDFDIFREAGGRNRAVVKEFKGIEVAGSLKIELVPKVPVSTSEQAPLLNGIEVIRTEPLRADLGRP